MKVWQVSKLTSGPKKFQKLLWAHRPSKPTIGFLEMLTPMWGFVCLLLRLDVNQFQYLFGKVILWKGFSRSLYFQQFTTWKGLYLFGFQSCHKIHAKNRKVRYTSHWLTDWLYFKISFESRSINFNLNKFIHKP